MNLKPLFVGIMLTAVLAGCNDKEGASDKEVALDTDEQKLSYVLGSNIATQFKIDEIDIDMAAFVQGFTDVSTGAETRITQEQAAETFEKLQKQMMEKSQAEQEAMEAAMAAAGEENQKAGDAFLAENAAKEGVVTTESGLQYKIIVAGSGDKPTLESRVEVHYRGRLLDGTEFDSSYKRNQPAQFGVTQVIPGWTEALQLMKEGAKWELYIPPTLAYGPGGAGQLIGPNSTLIFEVELLKAAAE